MVHPVPGPEGDTFEAEDVSPVQESGDLLDDFVECCCATGQMHTGAADHIHLVKDVENFLPLFAVLCLEADEALVA